MIFRPKTHLKWPWLGDVQQLWFFFELQGCICCRATVHRSWHTILKLHQPTHQWQFAVILIVHNQDNQNNYHCHHCYPPVNEHNYGKSPFSMVKFTMKWWFSIVFCMFTRGYHSSPPRQHQLWLLAQGASREERLDSSAWPVLARLHPKYVGSHEKSCDTDSDTPKNDLRHADRSSWAMQKRSKIVLNQCFEFYSHDSPMPSSH